MLMPAILPEHLSIYKIVANEQELYEILLKNRSDFSIFFEAACDDETWCDTFSDFTTKALFWFTEQFFVDRLSIDYVKPVAAAIQKHYANLRDKLPLDLTLQLFNDQKAVNSLLFQVFSPYIQSLIQRNSSENRTRNLKLFEVHVEEFRILQEYIYYGDVKELWKLSESEILRVLNLARKWGLLGLTESCEKVLIRYVDHHRLIEFMHFANTHSLELINKRCVELMNELHSSLTFQLINGGGLSCRLKASTVPTREILINFASVITHFIADNDVMEDPNLLPILQNSPKLISLDFGYARMYSERMLQIPKCIELTLSGSSWLNDRHLRSFFSAYPQLRKLNLTSCLQITAGGWGELLKASKLVSLDLSKCSNVRDKELSLILAAARKLQELNLNDCDGLSDKGFLAIAKEGKRLVSLDLGRTALTDHALMEIIALLPALSYLDVSRCHFLSERGILDAIKISALSEIHLESTNISPSALQELQALKPKLIIH